MLETNRYALKEWALVQEALLEGRQCLLPRKGGLAEKRPGFSVEHSEFFIYPTFWHQQRLGVEPSRTGPLEAMAPPSGQVEFSAYAAVAKALQIFDPERLEKIRGFQVLTEGELKRRFYYRNKPGLHLILLRVYRLPRPIRIPVLGHFPGCRSWVDLGRELSTAGCRAVLDDDLFERRVREISVAAEGP